VKSWIAFFTSPGAEPVLKKHGLEPAGVPRGRRPA